MTIFKDKDYLKIKEKLESTNIFKVLGLENYEIRHSNFLAWILDPYETHNLGSPFCKKLIQELFPEFSGEINDISIIRERHNIDILIECSNDILVIENKIKSKDHFKQLQKYREKIEDIKDYRQKKKHYSYLTLRGEEPTDTSEGKYWRIVSYEKLVKKLEELINDIQGTLDSKDFNFINNYIFSLQAYSLKNHEIHHLAKSLSNKYKEELLNLKISSETLHLNKNNDQRSIDFITENSSFYLGNGFFQKQNHLYHAFSEGLEKYGFVIETVGEKQTTYFSFKKIGLTEIPFRLGFRFYDKTKRLGFGGAITPLTKEQEENPENFLIRESLKAAREKFKDLPRFKEKPKNPEGRHIGIFGDYIPFNPTDFEKEPIDKRIEEFLTKNVLPSADKASEIVKTILEENKYEY